MKYKKNLILFLVLGLVFVSFSYSQNIYFSVDGNSTFGNGCTVPVDVYVNTEGLEISAMDLMMETSLIYKDFVPNKFFPYYLPLVVRANGLIHIVGFTVSPDERANGSGKIGTIYFEQKPGYKDGTVRLYFLKEGDTTDTNLSKAGGVDMLKSVGDINVSFSSNLSSCQHDAAVVSGGFASMTYQDSLDSTLQKIYEKYGNLSFWKFFQNNIFFVIVLFLLVVIIFVLIYRKKLLTYFNKNTVGRKSMQ